MEQSNPVQADLSTERYGKKNRYSLVLIVLVIIIIVIITLSILYFNQKSFGGESNNVIGDFDTFGNVTFSESEYIITEEADAGIFSNVILSKDIIGITFKYKFIKPGDGDFMSVHLNDVENNNSDLAYIGPDLEISRDDYIKGDAPLFGMKGNKVQIVFKLTSRGQPNAVLSIKSILVEYNPEIFGGKSLKDCKEYNGIKKEQCIIQVSSTNKEEILEEGICDNMIDEDNQMRCFQLQGIQKKDFYLCDKSGIYKEDCHLEISKESPDIKICDRMEPGMQRNYCYNDVAAYLGDVSICEKNEWNLGKIHCKRDVGIKIENVEICKSIDWMEMKSECFAGIAKKRNDSSVCNNVEEGVYRDLCNTRFNQ